MLQTDLGLRLGEVERRSFSLSFSSCALNFLSEIFSFLQELSPPARTKTQEGREHVSHQVKTLAS